MIRLEQVRTALVGKLPGVVQRDVEVTAKFDQLRPQRSHRGTFLRVVADRHDHCGAQAMALRGIHDALSMVAG